MSEANMNQTMYCSGADVTNRLLLKQIDVQSYTPELNYSIVEASRMVDTFMKPYEPNIPSNWNLTNSSTPPDQIVIITADFAASIFKRRWYPNEVKARGPLQPDMINDVDGTGWFALGLKKVLDFIKDFYALNVNWQGAKTATLINPEIFRDLFAKGVITLQEARAYMSNTNAAITQALNKIITENITTTELKYHTKKQHAFGFVAGNNNDEQTNQGGYNVQSQSSGDTS
jgi:hypothetical protein